MILIKVFDEEKWAKHFLRSGEMRFSKPSFFHNYEDNNSRRDEKEGLEGLIVPVKGRKLPKGVSRLYGFQVGTKQYEWRINVDGEGLELKDSFVQATRHSNVYIYSMFLVDLSESMNLDTVKAMKLDGKGKYCVLIHNPLEFSNRVKMRLMKKNKNVVVNKVDYVDFSKGNKEQIRLNHFTKDISYEGQNEVRFVIDNVNQNETDLYKNFHCGNISDIAIMTSVNKILDYIVAFADDWKYKTYYFPDEEEYRFIKDKDVES